MPYVRKGLGQAVTIKPGAGFSTGANVQCPPGYSIIPGASSAIIPTSSLATSAPSYCQDANGNLLQDVQNRPLVIAAFALGGATLLFAPGFLKLFAALPFFYGYCYSRAGNCTVSL